MIFVVLLIMGAGMFGHVMGYHAGVKDTEQRWSDAVGRAGHK